MNRSWLFLFQLAIYVTFFINFTESTCENVCCSFESELSLTVYLQMQLKLI